MVGGALLAVFGDPQHTRAWDNGADGERAVPADSTPSSTEVLSRCTTGGSGVLCKYQPHCGRPSGIYVMDAKYRETGRVQLRRAGGIFRPAPPQLWIGDATAQNW